MKLGKSKLVPIILSFAKDVSGAPLTKEALQLPAVRLFCYVLEEKTSSPVPMSIAKSGSAPRVSLPGDFFLLLVGRIPYS